MFETNNNLNKQIGGGLLENLSVPLGLYVFSETVEDDTSKTIFDIQTSNYLEPDILDKNEKLQAETQKDVVSNSLFDKLFSLVSLQQKEKNQNKSKKIINKVTKKNKKQIKVKNGIKKQTRKL